METITFNVKPKREGTCLDCGAAFLYARFGGGNRKYCESCATLREHHYQHGYYEAKTKPRRQAVPRKPPHPRAICRIEGCGRPAVGRNLCPKHYQQMTAEQRKQYAWPSRKREKLTREAVSEIRRRRSEEEVPVKQLAEEFFVSDTAIFDLLKGKTWKSVEEDLA